MQIYQSARGTEKLLFPNKRSRRRRDSNLRCLESSGALPSPKGTSQCADCMFKPQLFDFGRLGRCQILAKTMRPVSCSRLRVRLTMAPANIDPARFFIPMPLSSTSFRKSRIWSLTFVVFCCLNQLLRNDFTKCLLLLVVDESVSNKFSPLML